MKKYALLYDYIRKSNGTIKPLNKETQLEGIVEVSSKNEYKVHGKIIWVRTTDNIFSHEYESGDKFSYDFYPSMGDKIINENELEKYMSENLADFL